MKPTPPPKNTQPGLGRGRVQIALRRLFSLAVEVTTGEILPIGADNAQEIERGISAVAREPNSGLIVVPIPTTTMHHDLIVKLANSHRIPAVYPSRMYVADGGLVSYGWDVVDQYRSAASYVDRILRGKEPADLPVQAPVKYDLIINLKTAKAIGLDVPPTLLARADEVIE